MGRSPVTAIGGSSWGNERPDRRNGQEHAHGIAFQGLKAIALIQGFAAAGPGFIAAIENIQHDDRYSDPIRGRHNPAQRIDEQVRPIVLAFVLFVAANHGNVGCGNVAMRGAAASVFAGKVFIARGMGVDGIKSDDIAIGARHHEQTHIAGLAELVGGFPEVVIDLLDTAGKSRSIAPVRIERLYRDVL